MKADINRHERILGLLCALGVLGIWSGFFVFSRAGVLSGLTAYDVTALRFMVAGAVVAPFALTWWPSHLPTHAKVVMSISGPGALYTVLMYLGLRDSSAAHGGVFANGSMPVFTVLLILFVTRERPDRHQVLSIAILVVGAVLVGWPGVRAGGPSVAIGISLFLVASAVLSLYIFGLKHWAVTPREALALVSLPNAIVFLPLWYAVLPSHLAEIEWSVIVFQAIFQGLGPGFLAVILFAVSVRTLGSGPTAALAAAVPACAAMLAIPVLNEDPSIMEWIGISVVTLGLILLLGRPFDRNARQRSSP